MKTLVNRRPAGHMAGTVATSPARGTHCAPDRGAAGDEIVITAMDSNQAALSRLELETERSRSSRCEPVRR